VRSHWGALCKTASQTKQEKRRRQQTHIQQSLLSYLDELVLAPVHRLELGRKVVAATATTAKATTATKAAAATAKAAAKAARASAVSESTQHVAN